VSLAEFLAELRRRDIRLSLESGRLRCNAPAGALTAELREALRARKAELLEFLRDAAAIARHPEAIVPMQPRGSRIPVYGIGGHTGDFFAYQDFVRHLGDEQPFYGLHPPGLDERSRPLPSVQALATYFAAQLRAFHAGGPCIIAGYCAGGACALELARQLGASGIEVRFVALFGCPHPTLYGFSPSYWMKRIAAHAGALAALPTFREQRAYAVTHVRARLQAIRDERTPSGDDLVSRLRFQFGRATIAALKRHETRRYSGRVCLFLPNREWYREGGAALRWRWEAPRGEEYYGPHSVDPDRMLVDPHAAVFAALFNTACNNAEAAALASPPTRLVKIACFDSHTR
jgi:thioesterase domain-containing protein